MTTRPPISARTDSRVPYTTLFRSARQAQLVLAFLYLFGEALELHLERIDAHGEVGDRIGRTRPGKGRRLGRGDLRLDPLGRAARKHLALDRAHLAFEPVDALRDRAVILRIGHAGPETEAGGGGDNDGDRKSTRLNSSH